jgi:hypothetical protein
VHYCLGGDEAKLCADAKDVSIDGFKDLPKDYISSPAIFVLNVVLKDCVASERTIRIENNNGLKVPELFEAFSEFGNVECEHMSVFHPALTRYTDGDPDFFMVFVTGK